MSGGHETAPLIIADEEIDIMPCRARRATAAVLTGALAVLGAASWGVTQMAGVGAGPLLGAGFDLPEMVSSTPLGGVGEAVAVPSPLSSAPFETATAPDPEVVHALERPYDSPRATTEYIKNANATGQPGADRGAAGDDAAHRDRRYVVPRDAVEKLAERIRRESQPSR